MRCGCKSPSLLRTHRPSSSRDGHGEGSGNVEGNGGDAEGTGGYQLPIVALVMNAGSGAGGGETVLAHGEVGIRGSFYVELKGRTVHFDFES